MTAKTTHRAEAKQVRRLASELTDWVNEEADSPKDDEISVDVISATTYLFRYAFFLDTWLNKEGIDRLAKYVAENNGTGIKFETADKSCKAFYRRVVKLVLEGINNDVSHT